MKEVPYMTNYTTETYQTKRDILNFSKKFQEE